MTEHDVILLYRIIVPILSFFAGIGLVTVTLLISKGSVTFHL